MQRTRLGAIALGATALLGAALASPALAATDRRSRRSRSSTPPPTRTRTSSTSSTVTSPSPTPASSGSSTTAWSRSGDPWTDGLIVNTVGGVDDKWINPQVGNLTYCVSTKFGTRYADIVNAMNSGAGLWEAAAPRINFVYVPSQDASCNTRNKTVRLLGRARPDHAVHRPRVLPEHPEALAQRPGRRLDLDLGLLDADQHPRPRARPHARLPPRAHAPRGRHLLRGQQLAPADAVRLGVDHALPAVQRLVEQPLDDRHRPPGCGAALPRDRVRPSTTVANAPSVPSGGGVRPVPDTSARALPPAPRSSPPATSSSCSSSGSTSSSSASARVSPSTTARRTTPCSRCARSSRPSTSRRTTARATPRSRSFDGSTVHLIPEIEAALEKFAAADLLTLTLDEEVGGLQVPHVVASACMAWFTAANIGTAAYSFLTVANAGLLLAHGSPEQVERYVGADAGGPLLRHHDPLRAARRLEPGRRRHPRGARRRRHLPDLRQQDVDLRRRPRDGRQHRPPGAGQAARRARRVARHLALHRAEAPRRARTARSASATTSRSPASTTSSAAAARSTPRRSSATAPSRRVARPDAVGYLVGEPHKGLSYMFHMMNAARLGVGMSATTTAYTAYLKSLDYARVAPAGPGADRHRPDRAAGADHRARRRTPDAAGAEVVRRGGAGAQPLVQRGCSTSRRPPADDAERLARRPAPRRAHADREVVALAVGPGELQPGDPGARRLGLHPRLRRRGPLARPAAQPDPRGHARHPGARPARPQGARRGRRLAARAGRHGSRRPWPGRPRSAARPRRTPLR